MYSSKTPRPLFSIWHKFKKQNIIYSNALFKFAKLRVTPAFCQFSRTYSQTNRHYFRFRIPFAVALSGGISILSFGIKTNTTYAVSEEESTAEAKSPLHLPKGKLSVDDAISQSTDLLMQLKDEVGAPGLVIAASIDGKEVWNAGFGYADIENRLKCSKNTVMRIASISKAIAMTIVAKLWETGKLDIDKPVTNYVKEWPDKTFAEKKVEITTRQLVSHLGGIRHYDKNCGKKQAKQEEKSKDAEEQKEKDVTPMKRNERGSFARKAKSAERDESEKADKPEGKKNEQQITEFENKEYYIKQKYETVCSSLSLFKDDPLCSIPGTEFLYTTHGYTLVSAVAESAGGKSFEQLSNQLFRTLGMHHTYLDQNDPIIYGRARYYVKDKNGRLKNAPYVDNSYKWAGGGYVSSAGDLVRFANVMLYSYQQITRSCDKENAAKNSSSHHSVLPGYLKASTMKALWSPVDRTKCGWDKDGGYYGMGWGVMPDIAKFGHAMERQFYVSHTGGAIGASSVLLVLPRKQSQNRDEEKNPPEGIAVAIIINMQGVNLNPIALEIAKLFEKVDVDTI